MKSSISRAEQPFNSRAAPLPVPATRISSSSSNPKVRLDFDYLGSISFARSGTVTLVKPFSSLSSSRHQCVNYRPNSARQFCRFRCTGESSSGSSKDEESKPENALLKLAWYGSELLGIGVSFFRPPTTAEGPKNGTATSIELARGASGAVDRALIVETIKKDFERSYFVTGNLTPDAYEEECEFADPAGSFKGLGRFKRNCTNFGSLIEKSTMKLTKWEDMEDRGIGHWKFSCIMSFPWRPILSATGYTEYYFDSCSGKVCRHAEFWNVPKMALLKQIFRPTRDWLFFKTPT